MPLHRLQSLLGCSLAVLFLISLLSATAGAANTFQSVGLYQSVDELVSWASDFEAANPDIVHLVEFGRSFEDRPLLAIQMTLQPGSNNPSKPEFLFTAGLHAREVIGSQAAYELAEYLADGYRSGDPVFREILSEREVWIVPNLNPDGRVWVEGGYSRHRKNMELFDGQTASNYTRGVDLNRNFPHRWSDASDYARAETYRGPSALSTLEAGALWSLLQDDGYFNDLCAAIDFHSGIEAILSPWLSPSEFAAYPLPSEDRAKLDFLSARMSELTGFTTERLSYDAYGTLTDSLYEAFGTYALTEELYVGPAYDYFMLFNPLNQFGIDDSVGKAIDSSMFLLSDEAFNIVPEPTGFVLLALGGAMILPWLWRAFPAEMKSLG
jgi:hypothetical protein